ncbi:MAG: hypothetical protein ACYTFK_11965 [Planctomycetota bacterium]|jgi:hypothetical protein
MRITAKHPVRAELSDLPNYFDSEGDALYAVHAVLRRHNLRTDDIRFIGDDGYTTCELRPDDPGAVTCDCCAKRIDSEVYENCIVIAWYAMPSGRWELTTYIS